MKTVQDYIAKRQAEFSEHPFFTYLDNCANIEDFLAVSVDLAFWVMVFQDVLRLNESRVKDPYLRKLAKHHRIEDSGHDKWFLEDITNQSTHKDTMSCLFQKRNSSTRDAAYAIMSEVFNLHDERLRIVLLFTLESTGHIFFAKTAKYVDTKGYTDRLKYFSESHLEVEKAHAIFEEEMERKFTEIPLSLEDRSAAIALVDRVYEAFILMFDGLVTQLIEAKASKPENIYTVKAG